MNMMLHKLEKYGKAIFLIFITINVICYITNHFSFKAIVLAVTIGLSFLGFILGQISKYRYIKNNGAEISLKNFAGVFLGVAFFFVGGMGNDLDAYYILKQVFAIVIIFSFFINPKIKPLT
jgi:hypothetical protein